MDNMVTVTAQFLLTPDQAKLFEQILAREQVNVGEACRLLVLHHLDAFRTSVTMGIERKLPKREKRG